MALLYLLIIVKFINLSYCEFFYLKYISYICSVLNLTLMQRQPKFYNSEEVSIDLKLTSRTDKLGNVFHCVEYSNEYSSNGRDYACFAHLSSALDFINSNFKYL